MLQAPATGYEVIQLRLHGREAFHQYIHGVMKVCQ
jgi:hypothetical protein